MYKKKRGFTLVETSIYLSILAVVLTIFLQSFNFLKSIKDNIIEKDINKIHSFLMLGKSISKEKEVGGKIEYDEEKKVLLYKTRYSFDERDEQVSVSESLENVTIENINGKAKSLLINEKGSITTPCTISIKDNRGIEHKITINIGGSIDVKE